MMSAEQAISRALEAVKRRLSLKRTLRAGAAASLWLALCAAWWTLGRPSLAIALAGIGAIALVALLARRARVGDIALLIERSDPSLRNVLVSAVELREGRLRTSPVFRDAVLAEAGERASRVDPASVVPLMPSWRLVAASALAATALIVLAASVRTDAPRAMRADDSPRMSLKSGTPPVPELTVTLVPPAYLYAPPRELRSPERLDVLGGTTIDATTTEGGLRWTPEDGEALARTRSLRFTPETGGFLALVRGGQTLRVVPIAVRPDALPEIAIAQPKGDLVLPAAAPVTIAARATDDHALVSAELRYTRVSGSGEQFEFASGVLPLTVARDAANRWSLRAELPLARMGAQRGDAIVFRIAARDARGARGEGLSDALIVEIAAPGAAPAAGAAIDPTEDRFALSQQMILLKLRRLHAARASLGRERLLDQSQDLAAQQRSVRALFVFMLGGEVEDEEVEAAHSHEIQEGRLEDASRRDLVLATNLMSRVEQHLTAAETGAAIPPAEAAVEAVQRAFGRRRYFLRTTPVRMRIDPSRRLMGDTSAAAGLSVPGTGASPGTAGIEAMESLLQLASNAAAADRARIAAAAASLLRVDPRAADLQRLAVQIQHVDAADHGEVRAIATRALSALVAREQAERPGVLESDRERAALKSAWADRWRAGGGGR